MVYFDKDTRVPKDAVLSAGQAEEIYNHMHFGADESRMFVEYNVPIRFSSQVKHEIRRVFELILAAVLSGETSQSRVVSSIDSVLPVETVLNDLIANHTSVSEERTWEHYIMTLIEE